MKFYRPVDDRFPICAQFLEWGEKYEWKLDPDTGFWIPRGSEPGAKGQHRGVDFDCPSGTLLSACADGIVVKARYENAIRMDEGAGLHIVQIVDMLGYDAWWIKYSHLKTVMVKPGDHIRRGQPLGTTSANLHIDLMDQRHQFHPIPWQ